MKNCPICKEKLSKEILNYFDIVCKSNQEHFYTLATFGGTNLELAFRIEKICVNIMYRLGITKIWMIKQDNEQDMFPRDRNIVTISDIIKLDFTDIEKLKDKLQTYMLFS